MNNFWLKIDGVVVDAAAGQSVTLERYNPFFDFDVIRGAKVLDFSVPFSATTDKLFGYYRFHQSRLTSKKYYCEKYAEGILFEKGFIELAGADEKGYKLLFTQNLGEFFGDLQAVKMNLINFGSEPLNAKPSYDYATEAVAYPHIKNTSFYGVNIRAGFDGILNDVANGESPKVPMVGYPFLFRKIAELCNVGFEGEFFESEWFQRGIIDNTFEVENGVVRYQDHLPEMTIPEFLKELGKLLNMGLYIDTINRVVRYRFRDVVLDLDTEINYTTKVMPSHARTPERASRLELDWELDAGDNLMKVVPADFLKYQSAGSDEHTFFVVKSRISTRLKDAASDLAIAEQVGISERFSQKSNRFSAKMLLWNGIVNGKPTATNEFGGLRLAWHGVNNLKDKLFKNYEQFRANTAMRPTSIRLNAADMAKLDFHQNAGENSFGHINGKNYVFESIRLNLPIVANASVVAWEV